MRRLSTEVVPSVQDMRPMSTVRIVVLTGIETHAGKARDRDVVVVKLFVERDRPKGQGDL